MFISKYNRIYNSLETYENECEYFENVEKEWKESLRSPSIYELIRDFLNFKGAKGMIEGLERETKKKIFRYMDEKNQAKESFTEICAEERLEKAREKLKYLKLLISPKKEVFLKKEETVDRAKKRPISEFVIFDRSSKARCLWHSEKTGSLQYYPKQNTAYCFGGCGKKDVIDVFMQINNVDFNQAVKSLQ